MAISDSAALLVSGKRIPGLVLEGFRAVDPQLEVSIFHPPVTNADVVKTLGLRGRQIVVPMLVYDRRLFTSYLKIAEFFRDLETRKGEGKQLKIEVPNADGTSEKFDQCFYQGCELWPQGYKQDVCGTLGPVGAWFCEAVFFFYQAEA